MISKNGFLEKQTWIYDTMNAQNETTLPEIMPLDISEYLKANFEGDDEAEFIQAVLEIQQEIEDILMSDSPEDFLLPTETNLPPAIIFLEKLETLKSFLFADRVLARMEKKLRGIAPVNRRILTETDKASHPNYVKCPNCLRHFTRPYIGFHMETDVCVKVKTAHNLRPTGTKKIKVSAKIYNACYDLEDLYARAVLYQKHIERELIEEEYSPSNEFISYKYSNPDGTTYESEYEPCEECGIKPSICEGKGGYFCEECLASKPELCYQCGIQVGEIETKDNNFYCYECLEEIC